MLEQGVSSVCCLPFLDSVSTHSDTNVGGSHTMKDGRIPVCARILPVGRRATSLGVSEIVRIDHYVMIIFVEEQRNDDAAPWKGRKAFRDRQPYPEIESRIKYLETS